MTTTDVERKYGMSFRRGRRTEVWIDYAQECGCQRQVPKVLLDGGLTPEQNATHTRTPKASAIHFLDGGQTSVHSVLCTAFCAQRVPSAEAIESKAFLVCAVQQSDHQGREAHTITAITTRGNEHMDRFLLRSVPGFDTTAITGSM